MICDEKVPSTSLRTLNEWRDWLCDEEIPVFSNTIQRINSVVDDDTTSAMELARIIMADTTLTAKILKLGNSVHYNPSGQSIATLTRAVVILGCSQIQEMALTCTFIEAMQSARNKRRASQEIARSLHAATQARAMAALMRDPSPEEMFVATLLFNIGHIAFSFFEQAIGDEIDKLMLDDKLPPDKAEKRVLGFTLRQLGAALSKTWNLAGLTEEVFSGRSLRPERVQLVKYCHDLVIAAEQHGWNAEPTRKIAQDLARLLDKPVRAVLNLAQDNAKTAAEIAVQLGANDAAKLIPLRARSELFADDADANTVVDPTSLLIRVHRDITSLLSSDFNINVLFELVLESIHRGLQMDRTLFALITPDRKYLKEKSSHGWTAAGSRYPTHIALNSQPPHILTHALSQTDALWVRPDADPGVQALFTQSIQTTLGMHECFLIPLSLNRKPIGLIYADRAISGAPLDQDAFDHFRQLGQQAIIGLRLASIKE